MTQRRNSNKSRREKERSLSVSRKSNLTSYDSDRTSSLNRNKVVNTEKKVSKESRHSSAKQNAALDFNMARQSHPVENLSQTDPATAPLSQKRSQTSAIEVKNKATFDYTRHHKNVLPNSSNFIKELDEQASLLQIVPNSTKSKATSKKRAIEQGGKPLFGIAGVKTDSTCEDLTASPHGSGTEITTTQQTPSKRGRRPNRLKWNPPKAGKDILPKVIEFLNKMKNSQLASKRVVKIPCEDSTFFEIDVMVKQNKKNVRLRNYLFKWKDGAKNRIVEFSIKLPNNFVDTEPPTATSTPQFPQAVEGLASGTPQPAKMEDKETLEFPSALSTLTTGFSSNQFHIVHQREVEFAQEPTEPYRLKEIKRVRKVTAKSAAGSKANSESNMKRPRGGKQLPNGLGHNFAPPGLLNQQNLMEMFPSQKFDLLPGALGNPSHGVNGLSGEQFQGEFIAPPKLGLSLNPSSNTLSTICGVNSMQGIGGTSKSKSKKSQEEIRAKARRYVQQGAIRYGSKIDKLTDNDMVCKLTYGHLNRTVEVTKKDLLVLEPRVYLNDILILFYLRFLQHYVIPQEVEKRLYIYDPQFFTKLREEDQSSMNLGGMGHASTFNINQLGKPNKPGEYSIKHGFGRVKRWTKKVDLFQQEFILIPICENQHWSLAIVYKPQFAQDYMQKHIEACLSAGAPKPTTDNQEKDLENAIHEAMPSRAPPASVSAADQVDLFSDDASRHSMAGGGPDPSAKHKKLDSHQSSSQGSSSSSSSSSGGENSNGEGTGASRDSRDFSGDANDECTLNEKKLEQKIKSGKSKTEAPRKKPASSFEAYGDEYDEEMEDDENAGNGEEEEDEPMYEDSGFEEDFYSRGMMPTGGRQQDFEGSDFDEDEDAHFNVYKNITGNKFQLNQFESERAAAAENEKRAQELMMEQLIRENRQKRREMPKEASKDKPIILYMDSLNSQPAEANMTALREYLEMEFLDKKVSADHKKFFSEKYDWNPFDFDSMPHYQPNLPKQKNFTDCGLFLLEYAETFMLQPDFITNNLHQVNAELFKDNLVDEKRDTIKRIIIAMAESTCSSIKDLGEKYSSYRTDLVTKKTHITKPKEEESKVANETEMPDSGDEQDKLSGDERMAVQQEGGGDGDSSVINN